MFGGGIEIYDALIPVAGDDGVTDLPEDLATEAVRFSVQALKSVYLRTHPILNHQSIDFSATDRAKHLLGLAQLRAQLGVLCNERRPGKWIRAHGGSTVSCCRRLFGGFAKVEPEQDSFGLRQVA